MARGDQLEVNRGGLRHHGVDLGDGTVVHFARYKRSRHKSEVRRTSRWQFARGNPVRVVSHPVNGLTADDAVERANFMVGTRGYNVISHNCEHVATWAVTGVALSAQIEELAAGVARALRRSARTVVPLPLLGWATSQFGLRLCGAIRERCSAREYLTQYSALWMGDSWLAGDGRPYALVRDLRWVSVTPGGLVRAPKPTEGRLAFRLWMDPLQTTFASSPEGELHLVGAEQTVDVLEAESPLRIGAPLPTLLRRDDSVFTEIERHGLPTPQAWEWPG